MNNVSARPRVNVHMVIMMAIMTAILVVCQLLQLAILTGYTSAHLFPEELVGFWGVNVICTVSLTVLYTRGAWRV